MRILLAEDDGSIAEGISASLRHGGHTVDHAARGNLADAALREHDYDLVVLDLGLPALDGSEVLRRLHCRGTSMPVLVVTARDGLAERIRVLDLGAAHLQQVDLAGHAFARADAAGAPVLLQHFPTGTAETIEQRVDHVLDGNGAVEIAQDGPAGYGHRELTTAAVQQSLGRLPSCAFPGF
jgi:CheY-like chemotaxis protein